MNDTEPKASEQPTAPVNGQPQLDPGQFLQTWLGAAMQCTIRGAISSLQGFAPGDVVVMACRVMGTIVGSIFHGDPLEVLGRRKQCREAFLEALRNSPSPPMRAAPEPPMTAPPRRVNGADR